MSQELSNLHAIEEILKSAESGAMLMMDGIKAAVALASNDPVKRSVLAPIIAALSSSAMNLAAVVAAHPIVVSPPPVTTTKSSSSSSLTTPAF